MHTFSALVFFTAATAQAQSADIKSVHSKKNSWIYDFKQETAQRPANFYRLEKGTEPAICSEALKALNEKGGITDNTVNHDVLINNSAMIPWKTVAQESVTDKIEESLYQQSESSESVSWQPTFYRFNVSSPLVLVQFQS